MKENIKFYVVNEDYIEYLSKFDKHVSWNKEQKRPYIGIVLKVEKYKDLLQAEINFINDNKEEIYSKAKKIYRNVTELKIPFFRNISCDFQLLEKKSDLLNK